MLAAYTGYVQTTMAEVLGTQGQTATLPLADARTGRTVQGTVSVRMDEIEHQHDLVTLKLRAQQVRPRPPSGGPSVRPFAHADAHKYYGIIV